MDLIEFREFVKKALKFHSKKVDLNMWLDKLMDLTKKQSKTQKSIMNFWWWKFARENVTHVGYRHKLNHKTLDLLKDSIPSFIRKVLMRMKSTAIDWKYSRKCKLFPTTWSNSHLEGNNTKKQKSQSVKNAKTKKETFTVSLKKYIFAKSAITSITKIRYQQSMRERS